MPTGGRSCWAGPHCGGAAAILRGARFRRGGDRGRCVSRRATRPICMPLRPSSWRPPASARPLYLRTSPEFACKKLLAAGERRIFEFARSFRNRERGALHHPEFTHARMVSGGRALRGPDGRLHGGPGAARRRPPARCSSPSAAARIDPFAAPERLTVADGLQRSCRHRPSGGAAAGRAFAASRPPRAGPA